jgi:hypothetical protein
MEDKKQEVQFSSGYFYRVLKGDYNPFRPNIIRINKNSIEFRKRNWHLISVDSKKYHIQKIVGVDVDKHLFGATVIIESTGSKSIYIDGISKKTADRIADIVFQYTSVNT